MPLSDSSGTYMRAVRPKPPPAVLLLVGSRRLRGLPVLVHEASRRVWGLRLRRTDQELALALLLILPTAHYKDGGVRIASFRSWIPTSPSPCLRFTESLAVSAQDSGPSRSLVFTRKALSSSASCRFIPAHCHRDISPIDRKS